MSHHVDDPQDLAMIAADDELLDLLAAGGEPRDGDEVVAMLGAWRADVATDLPTVRRASPAIGAVLPDAARISRGRSRPTSGSRRMLVAAAAIVVALAGTLSVMASDARPGSPLWPITRLLYAERASSAAAEQEAMQNIEAAQQAIDNSQYSDAQRLLDQASALVDKVRDPTVAQRLREQIAELRGLIPGLLPGATPTQGSTAAPTTARTTAPDGGIVPTSILPTGLPSLPLPSLPLPLPSLPL
jgi:hypothetical protein